MNDCGASLTNYMRTILLIFITALLPVCAAEPKVSLPRGLVSREGARVEAASGLPVSAVHPASGIDLVLIPAGEFLMGSPEGEAERGRGEHQHRRIIRRPFYLGHTEVTVGQFRRFVRATGYETDAERGARENDHTNRGAFASTPDGDRTWTATAYWRNPFPILTDYRIQDDHPVVQISWNDAQRFTQHFGLQLPTEAQWEYAARAGSCSRFFWGESMEGGDGFGNFQDASGRKRFKSWNSSFPFDDGATLLSAVGRYRPNPWGIYDPVGNVSEWTADPYGREYPPAGSDEFAISPEPGPAHVMRGSSWLDSPDLSRSAKRFGFAPAGRRDFIGFRFVMNIGTNSQAASNPP